MPRSNPLATETQAPLVLLVPGLDGSDPGQWQRRWAEELSNCRMVELGPTAAPHRNTWINRLNLAVHQAARPVIIVAHSLGCLLTAWWAKFEQPRWSTPVIGALLVAPPEVDFFPRDNRLNCFAPTPSDPLPFPSILAASRNDPWIGFHTAKMLARQWGSRFVDVGELGHINTEAGVGGWATGKRLLGQLMDRGIKADAQKPLPVHADWSEGLEYRS